MCVYACVLVLRSLLFPSRRGRTSSLSSECRTDQAHFTDCMSILPSDLLEEISPISQKPSAQIPNAFNQHGIPKKVKKM